MPKRRFTPLPTFMRTRTGSTCATWSTFSSSTSPILIGTGAVLTPIRKDALGGCTMISAPIPSTRFAVSFSMPVVIPTTSSTMPTSRATARMLMMVRTGRWSRFEMTILVSMGRLRAGDRAEFDRLGASGLLQLKFVRIYFLIERRLLDGDRKAVVFDGADDLDFGRIDYSREILVGGIVRGLDQRTYRTIKVKARDFQIRPVEPDFALRKKLVAVSRLKYRQDIIVPAGVFRAFE